MNGRDRRLLLRALDGRIPAGWRVQELGDGAPRGVALIPPTGMARQGRPLPWPGPGPMPRGLGLCRVLATAEHDSRFGEPGERVVLVRGLPGDGAMRRLNDPFTGRGWHAAMADLCIQAAEALHRGARP